MLREILFKGKAVNTSEWVESMTIANGTIKRKKDDVFFEVDSKWIGIEKKTLCQYSGEKDKNNNKIFEGDLFKLGVEKHVFEVRFVYGCFMAFLDNKQYGLIGELKNMFIEITGNIHNVQECKSNDHNDDIRLIGQCFACGSNKLQ